MKTLSTSLFDKYGITRYQCQLADIVLFKISWLLLVELQDSALVYAMVILLVRLLLTPAIVPALLAMAAVTVLGLAMDTLLAQLGLFIFNDPWLPSWLVLLWVSFALVLHHGFAFVSTWQSYFQALAGVAFGVAGYTAGYLMGAVFFAWPYSATMLVVALLWALYLPLTSYCMQRVVDLVHAP